MPPAVRLAPRDTPLPPELRATFEAAFAADLLAVRVRTATHGPPAAAAWATGDYLYFRRGFFAPHTPWGRWLLAHEVAHTLQMRGAARADLPPADTEALERE